MTTDPTGHATPEPEITEAFLAACQALGIPNGAQLREMTRDRDHWRGEARG